MEDGKSIDQLDAVDREIIKLKFTNRKLSLTEIGKLLPDKMTKQAVFQRLNKPQVKKAWEMLEADVLHELKQLQHDAVQVFKETLKCPDIKLRFAAAKALLEKVLIDSDGMLPDTLDDEILEFVS